MRTSEVPHNQALCHGAGRLKDNRWDWAVVKRHADEVLRFRGGLEGAG